MADKQLSLAYAQFLKGYNYTQNFAYKDYTPNLPFMVMWAEKPLRAAEKNKSITEEGESFYHPIYELATADFDRWCAVHSEKIKLSRWVAYTQYVSLDGYDARPSIHTVEEMDEVRRGIAYAVNPRYMRDVKGEDIYLNDETYINVAIDGMPLREDYLDIVQALPHEIANEREAYLVLCIWRSCWERMWSMMQGESGDDVNHVDIAIRRFTEDRMKTCMDVFTEWLSRILPPQVMSMICVTVGAAYDEAKWNNSVCRIMYNADADTLNDGGRSRMFDLDNVVNGVPSVLGLPSELEMEAWERELVQELSGNRYPKYYQKFHDLIHKGSVDLPGNCGRFGVALLADYEILKLCTLFEMYIKNARERQEFYNANICRYNIAERMVSVYGLTPQATHILLHEMEKDLAEAAKVFAGSIEFYNYLALLEIYCRTGDAQLKQECFNTLASQFEADGQLLLRNPDVMEQKDLFRALELQMATAYVDDGRAGSLSCEEYRELAEMHKTADSEGDRGVCDALEAVLSCCLHFLGDEKTPLQIAEEYGIDNVIRRLVVNIVEYYYRYQRGKLEHEQYAELIQLREDYSGQMDAEVRNHADEMLAEQYKLEDSPESPADMLYKAGMEEVWNRCLTAECSAAKGQMTDEEYNVWVERLECNEIKRQTADSIVEMLTNRAAKDGLNSYIAIARGKELTSLKDALVRRALRDIEDKGNKLEAADYEWWVNNWKAERDDGNQIAAEIFDTLRHVQIKGGEYGILELTRKAGAWSLLGELAKREAKQVESLNNERFDRWVDVYSALTAHVEEVSNDAIIACEQLLSTKITWETLQKLQKKGIRGNIYWDSMHAVLDDQNGKSMGRMKISVFRQWLSYLREAENAERSIAGDIRVMLSTRLQLTEETSDAVINAYDLLDSEDFKDDELRRAMIREEYKALERSGRIRDVESLKRWLRYYRFMKRNADSLADDIEKYISAYAMIDGHYILETVLGEGCDVLEESILNKEKECTQDYTEPEYCFRMERYFANRYAELYCDVLSAKRFNHSKALDLLLTYLKEHSISGADERKTGKLMKALMDDTGRIEHDAMERLRELSKPATAAIRSVLGNDQELLLRVVNEGIRLNLSVHELSCFTSLIKGDSIDVLAERVKQEFADALVKGREDYSCTDLTGYYKGTITPETAGSILSKVNSIVSGHVISSVTLKNAIAKLAETRMPEPYASDMLCSLLKEGSGQIDMPLLMDYADAREPSCREKMLLSLTHWLQKSPVQADGTLDDIIAFASRLQGESLGRVSDELFKGVVALLSGEVNCKNTRLETYERICNFWQDAKGTDFARVRDPLLNGCAALTGAREKYLNNCMAAGPVRIEPQYAELNAAAAEMQRERLRNAIQEATSPSELSESLNGLIWLDEAAVNVCRQDESIIRSFRSVIENSIQRKTEEARVSGDKTAELTALYKTNEEMRNLEIFPAAGNVLKDALKEQILARAQNVFTSCISLYSKNADGVAFNDAMDRLGMLLKNMGADKKNAVSEATIAWCREFASMVREGRQDNASILQVYAERSDLAMLKRFVQHVYKEDLSRRDYVDASCAYALLTAAKVLNMNDIWTQYLSMAIHLPEGKPIWSAGKDTEIIMDVVFVYGLLKDIGDDIATENTLSDYCMSDQHFSDLAVKQHNKELGKILKKGNASIEKKKSGLFGLFRK